MKILFTSDTHFAHKKIIEYSRRPFSSVEEMDKALLDNINKIAGADDVLYHLGDFCFGEKIKHYRSEIKCKNVHLIFGNHDEKHRKAAVHLFKSTQDLLKINVNTSSAPTTLILGHYAQRVWLKKPYGALHLYGHSHGELPDEPNDLSMDVGVDFAARMFGGGQDSYRPFTLDEIIEYMNKKPAMDKFRNIQTQSIEN